MTISGTLSGASGVTAVNTVATASTGKAIATLQATSTELASLSSSSTDEIVVTVTDTAPTTVEATALSAIGGKSASAVTVSNAVTVSGTLSEATAAFVAENTKVIGSSAVVQLDDASGTSISASSLNTLSSAVASVQNASGITLTGTQGDVTTALTTSGITFPNNDYNVSITNAFGIDTALVNMYNSVASSTSGVLSVTGTGFNDTSLNASSFTGNGSKGLTIDGGAGNDTIVSTGFADTIIGGSGADTLTGGSGTDTFVFTTSADSVVTAFDTIMDFTSNSDDIKTGVTSGATSLNQGTSYTATGTGSLGANIASAVGAGNTDASHTAAANDAYVVTITGTGAGTYVFQDTDGDATVDAGELVILLGGTSDTTLIAGDFIV